MHTVLTKQPGLIPGTFFFFWGGGGGGKTQAGLFLKLVPVTDFGGKAFFFSFFCTELQKRGGEKPCRVGLYLQRFRNPGNSSGNNIKK